VTYEGAYAGLTPGQYRTFLAGFAVPLMAGIFGIVFPVFAMATGAIKGSDLFVLVPGFVLAGWTQVEMALAGGRDPARAAAAKGRVRGLLLVPMLLIPVAAAVSLVGLLRLPAGQAYPAGYGLVVAVIGAAFLPLTARARRIPWLQG
jgi:hypothetical protein